MCQGNKDLTQPAIESLKDFSANDDQTEITIRPAIPKDYKYYLEVYPDLEVDQPATDETSWINYDLPEVAIITQNIRPVGYIWTQKYDEMYCLRQFIVGKEHRRKGIGTKALKYLKNHANQLGFGKWGLECDPDHSISYNMYVKMGMEKVGEYYHIKAPYRSQSILSIDLKVTVIHDPQQWPTIEGKYGIRKGRVRLWTASGSLAVLLVDVNDRPRGFALFLPAACRVFSLVVDDPDDFTTFLKLLQGLKTEDANPEWIHFWIDTGKQYSEVILSSIPDAILCGKYDRLEGNTSDVNLFNSK